MSCFQFWYEQVSCTCESRGLEAKFQRGQVCSRKPHTRALAQRHSPLPEKSVPSSMLIKSHSPPLCKDSIHKGRGKQGEDKKRRHRRRCPSQSFCWGKQSWIHDPSVLQNQRLRSKSMDCNKKVWMKTRGLRAFGAHTCVQIHAELC